MTDLPTCVVSGERARLFPILSERSIEGRTLSIFLATLCSVRPLAERLLEQMGRRIGPQARIHAWTEVRFAHQDDDGHGHDGW